ncbi:hypothetical protein [Rhodococcus artemisiae]|uniref:Uncharacterized protein n=1 Tax=Rhodococcus artemisiae TaxID=714159 RepID=A0ABU7LAD6_9NOCA|nr:hypothetical protein [Rhodococcus artemisiae]MEE2058252.1 hypothetical protein [Rhodococcus artemisiae]
MTATDARPETVPALITRTEYADGPALIRKLLGVTFLLAPIPLLLVLALVGVPSTVIVVVVGASVTCALAMRSFGSLAQQRAAVRLGVVDEQILIGTEDTADDVRPLSELTDVALSKEQSPTTRIAPDERDLRVRGVRSLQLTFRDGAVYVVALLETDPVAIEIMQRLRRAVPARPRTYPQMKPAGHRTATEPAREAAEPQASRSPEPVETSASPAADVRLWEAARVVHNRVLSEYGAYELDPALYLRYPGVTDITREAVMDFHTALEEAQALATDTYPGDAAFAGRYRTAVDALRRRWARCERDGKAAGTGYLPSEDGSDLDTAAKLYNHARSTDNAEEKASYLRKVQQIIQDLDGRGRVHLPQPVVSAIETQVRLALGPGTNAH